MPLEEIEQEVRINLWTILNELNRLRAKEGLGLLPIVVGHTPEGTPIYQK
jgi:hypothetical protein